MSGQDNTTTQGDKRLCIETYGCQMNVADSEVVASVMKTVGYTPVDTPEEADAILLNTCSIRDNAEQKILSRLQYLASLRRKRHGSRLIIGVIGCMAERVKDDLIANHGVDLVAGPDSYMDLPNLISAVEAGEKAINIELSTTETYRDIIPTRLSGNRVSGFISIMRGCNNFCSYCIVPYVRGRERSREADHVLAEVRSLVEAGYREITLLGQNVNSYGKDLDKPMDFADLLREIDRIPGDYLVRFMTSHPKDAGRKLFETMAECSHVARQLHLPVQSGSSRVLKAMNRGYTREQYLEKVRMVREAMPDVVLTSDIITGFPGETEAEAMETVSLIEEVRYDALFTFIYSPRPGTPAAKLPDPVSRAEKQVWFDRLLDAQNRISGELHRAYVGKTLRVLADGESGDPDWPLSSRTAGGRLVHLRGDGSLIGRYVEAKITGSNTWALFGEAL